MKSKKPSILIVDDREENFFVFEALLNRDVYELVWANSGKQALKLVAEQSFALILLDVQMPEMNGFSVLGKLKSMPACSHIPVILVTANYFSREDEVIAFKGGVSDIFIKPIVPEIVISKVKVFVDLSTAADQAAFARAEINELKELREDRKQAQIRFEKNVDVSPAILWITEKDGSCTYLSRQWQEFTGQTMEQALGFGWLDATHPDDKERSGKTFVEANANQVPFYTEYRLRTKDGNYRWAIDAGNPRYDKDGNYLGYAGTVFDIHDRVESESRRRDFQAQFENLANSIPQLAWMAHADGHIFWYNQQWFDYTGTTQEQMEGWGWQTVHDPKALPSVIKRWQRSLQTGDFFEMTFPLKGKDGNFREFLTRVTPVRDDSGKVVRWFGTNTDIQNERDTAAALRLAKDEAERANILKSAFLANMSHEIRTPLGAMIGFADLLRDPSLSTVEKANYIDILARNGQQLSVIINDILDLSKVEAGHLTLEYTQISADKIASDVISLLRVTAKEKGLVLEYHCGETTPEVITSDPTRVRQILVNLIGNAIKFTQFGSVKIRSYGCKTDDGKDSLCFEIQDTGIGIADSQKEKIFEMFVQADGSMTRRFGGTGLGLALSRRLARELGGDVHVLRTEENRGTIFKFVVADQPTKLESKASITRGEHRIDVELPADALKDVCVLVVDDAPDNQQLIWRYLTKRGAKVDSAENGFEGYNKALAGNYDVVLMDIQMPLMDGFTATQKLREAGYSKPIIALTAHAMTEVRAKCFDVGYTDHLSKPINPKELIAAVAAHAVN